MTSKTATLIAGEKPYCGIINIPSIVTFKNRELPVVAIDRAFQNCTDVVSISIPSSVKTVSDKSFIGCKSLEELIIEDSEESLNLGINGFYNEPAENRPSNVTEYEWYYYNNRQYNLWSEGLFSEAPLKKIYIGRNVEYITGSNIYEEGYDRRVTHPRITPFSHHTYDEVVIGGSVTQLYGITFKSCTIKSIHFKEGREIDIIDDKYPDKKELYTSERIRLLRSEMGIEYIISERSGYNGPANPFKWLKSLKTLTIGDNCVNMPSFEGCTNLTEVHLGESLETVCDNAFRECINLQFVDIPQSVTCINESAFAKSGLKKINLKGGLSVLKPCAFFETPIESIIMPNSVKSIGNRCFYNCKYLKNITLSDSINTIPSECFYGCEELVNFTFPINLEIIKDLSFWGCANLSQMSFPATLTTIEDNAFNKCVGLKSITFGPWLENIGLNAFQESDIDYITSFAATPPLIENESCFNDYTYFNCILKVPSSSIENYSVDNTWKHFWNIESISIIPVESIIFNSEIKIIGYNEIVALKPTILPIDASMKDLKWSSSQPSIASVSEDGVITTSSREGEAIITATACDGTNVSASIKIIVQEGAGISNVVAGGNLDISIKDGCILVSGKSESDIVEIFNIQGQLITSSTSNIITLNSGGVYLVKIGSVCKKIIL
ncbi:MAG: leucine-rich repeat protein [Muribaculaceae bacterium]